MYKLFYYPRNASWAPHMVLEELGEDFELVLVDRKQEAQKSKDYLALNPTGRIPTLVDGDLTLFKSAAICLHICEKNPKSQLIPAIGSPERTKFHQWLFYLTSSIQSELMLYFYPNKHTSEPEAGESIKETQEQRVTEMFALVDKALAESEFLVGNQLTFCDFFLFMLSHWASGFQQPPLAFEHLGRYLRAMAKLPTVRKVCEVEGTSLEQYQ